ncbi:Multiple resistance and pH regulation protein F (mrpF / PhaF) [Thermococcus onnurineus NA1]|uniref:Multiple resistance and pH regulation protein F (MrpF / PhaF) n=1 Tax=Thermococcus onnurineus (strain NA1) TaxID=523850 RepID=B6YXK9_THEON|nr:MULTISPECIES: monovalent cation/H+ antiporter complex subunit F [Thermococcus]ACJ16822.1 Multiple resistance and pH regulation protein F (mrpF / PhaF) [Thermococcus onnurineus NA1]NJE43392.1 cation:proton antiporter [Thermococcus sp. GR6]NJE46832.1 cation:proton antiporter [Thermococcus sp. GR7]NJE78329.1 cation:proton antiporter [Thermococcus sp. GR4]NJF23374.1 cation:proton antiporter [Thermococcus sp. GR5]
MAQESLLVSTFYLLVFTAILITYRVVRGPTLPDRIVGLNTITTKVVMIIAIVSVIRKEYYLIDLAIVLLMVNAVGGLILAKYLERRAVHD